MNKEIKLFLSSTFDKRMHARRDYFKNEINAHLNRIVGKIGKNLFVYDYEVGIPKETEFSDVLNVCFEKIDACNYFVAIIDNRYGCNIHSKIKDCTGVKKQYQKLVKKGLEKKLSVLELEIIRAFENKDTKKFFFIHQDVQNINSRLQNLIQYIKTNAPSENIKDFSQNSEILTFLEKHFIEKNNDILHQYPEEEQQRRNLMYANKMRYYVEDDTTLNVLNNYITDDCNKVLVLNGKSGSGKSTLLLNWIEQHHSDTDKNIISCFVDIDGYTVSDVFRKLKNQNTESQSEDFDDKKDEISILDSFIPFTYSLSKKHKKNIIVLDGLDQINFTNERKGEAARYYWLNETLPKNVKVIVSTTDNRVDKTKFLVHSITPYSLSKIVKYHLKKEGKELLYPDFEKHINFNNKNIDNIPVVARLICSEICMTADYKNLSQFLIKYNEQLVSGASIIDLHEAFLKRITQRNNIVPEICSYLWCSESGLDANTLCKLFALQGKSKKEQVENFNTMLYSDLRTNVDGRMEFSHSYFKVAAEKLYVENNQNISHYRNDIIEILQKDKLSEQTLPECAYQINMLKNKNKMFELLSNIYNAKELYNLNRIQFLGYLNLIDEKVKNEIFQEYDNNLKEEYIEFLSIYNKEISNNNKAIKYYNKLLDFKISKLGLLHSDIVSIYNAMAEVYCAIENFKSAWNFNNKAKNICEKLFGLKHYRMADIYNSFGFIRYHEGKYKKSIWWFNKALNIRKTCLGEEHKDVASSYLSISACYYKLEDYKKFLEMSEKSKELYEKTLGTYHPRTALSYNNIAMAHSELGNHIEAIKMYDKAIPIYEEIYGKLHPETAKLYHNKALGFSINGKYDEAIKEFKKVLKIKKDRFGKHHLSTANTYFGIAQCYDNINENGRALKYYFKSYYIRLDKTGKESIDTLEAKKNMKITYLKTKNRIPFEKWLNMKIKHYEQRNKTIPLINF